MPALLLGGLSLAVERCFVHSSSGACWPRIREEKTEDKLQCNLT
jgi:hypothetical protein